MSRGAVQVLVCTIVGFGLLAACRRPGSAGIVAEHLNVVLTVQADGSIEVEEQWRVRFDSGGPTRFARHTPASRHDGVFAVEGAMDGRPSKQGTGPGDLHIAKGPALDAAWPLEPRAGSRHSFVLRSRATGVVETSGIRGIVSFRILAPRDYDIESADVTLKLPAGAVLLDDPWVEEAGWIVERRPNGLVASRRNVSRDEWATAGASFTIDTMTAGEPSWQYHQRRARDLMPAFVSAGLFLAVIGAGAVAMVRLKYPPIRPCGLPAAAMSLTPAMEEALVRQRYPRDTVPSLVSSGLVDVERLHAARDLRRAGIVTMLFGAVTWVVAQVAFDQFGLWPLAIPIGILASGLMFVLAAPRLPILSQHGVEARALLYSARVRDGRTSA